MFSALLRLSLASFLGWHVFLLSPNLLAAPYSFDLENPQTGTAFDGQYAESFGYSNGSLNLDVGGLTSNPDGSQVRQDAVGIFPTYGLGIGRSDTVEHTVDNYDGYDFLSLSFSEVVILDAVTSGWHANDSDISILALTGIFDSGNWDGTWSGLTSSGFTHIGDYLNLLDDQSTEVNSSEVRSQFWLLGAYNDRLDSTTSYSANDDFLKFSGVSVSTVEEAAAPAAVPVSVPGTLGLLAIGLMGFLLSRRLRA